MGQPGRPVAAAGTAPCTSCSQDLSKPMVFQGVLGNNIPHSHTCAQHLPMDKTWAVNGTRFLTPLHSHVAPMSLAVITKLAVPCSQLLYTPVPVHDQQS